MYFLVYPTTYRHFPSLNLKMDVMLFPKRRYLYTTLNGITFLKIPVLLPITLRTTKLTHFSVTLQHPQQLTCPIYSHVRPGSYFTRYSPETSLAAFELTLSNYTSQQDFGTRKVYRFSNVTFHAESKYAIKIFPSPTVFVQWPF